MKILLTGKPGIGKSTILQEVKDRYSGEINGIISREIKENNIRIGFEAVRVDGKAKIFAHNKLVHSNYIIGNKYHVDLNAINSFVVPEISFGLRNNKTLVFLDEIGRMQAISPLFLETVKKLLDSDANILATIVLDPEPWSIPFKEHNMILLINVVENNRTILPELLQTIFQNKNYYDSLSQNQKRVVLSLSKKYFSTNQFIQINKLFKHALQYISANRVQKINNGVYSITGHNNTHTVEFVNQKYLCDCDLFNGRGIYKSSPGECSHVQVIKILLHHLK